MQLFSERDKPVACKRSNKDSCHDLGLRGSLLWWRALWRPNMLLCKCLLQENYDDVLKNQLKCNITAKIHDCTVHDANSTAGTSVLVCWEHQAGDYDQLWLNTEILQSAAIRVLDLKSGSSSRSIECICVKIFKLFTVVFMCERAGGSNCSSK